MRKELWKSIKSLFFLLNEKMENSLIKKKESLFAMNYIPIVNGDLLWIFSILKKNLNTCNEYWFNQPEESDREMKLLWKIKQFILVCYAYDLIRVCGINEKWINLYCV